MPQAHKNVPKLRRFIPWIAAFVVAIVIVGLLASAAHSALNLAGRMPVVAAENTWGNIASQIGGDKVYVTSILSNPNADPHLYESDARDAAVVSTAAVVVENGLGYDSFIDKLMTASPARNRTVINAATVLGASKDANPHLWYDTGKVPQVAQAIETAYETHDPKNAAYYRQNLANFDKSLSPITAEINNIRAKYAGAPVAYTERVPGYLLQEANLRVVTPLGFATAIEEGTSPGPASMEQMQRLIIGHDVRVLLYNTQVTSSVTQHLRILAEQNHIPVVGMSETMPTDQSDFQNWQLSQDQALQNALGR